MKKSNRPLLLAWLVAAALCMLNGNVARAQDPCDTAGSRAEIEACLQGQMKHADSLLSSQLANLEAKMKRMHMSGEWNLVRKEQSAWQTRANSICDWVRKQYRRSDRAQVVYLVYRRGLYQQRAAELAGTLALLELED